MAITAYRFIVRNDPQSLATAVAAALPAEQPHGPPHRVTDGAGSNRYGYVQAMIAGSADLALTAYQAVVGTDPLSLGVEVEALLGSRQPYGPPFQQGAYWFQIMVGGTQTQNVDDLNTSVTNLNAWATALATKLNADAGVTDTNYDTNPQA